MDKEFTSILPGSVTKEIFLTALKKMKEATSILTAIFIKADGKRLFIGKTIKSMVLGSINILTKTKITRVTGNMEKRRAMGPIFSFLERNTKEIFMITKKAVMVKYFTMTAPCLKAYLKMIWLTDLA
jgi:hypothetical protein